MKGLLERIAYWFRDLDYSSEREEALTSYAQARHRMLFHNEPLPRSYGVDEAMQLRVGATFPTLVGGYCTRVVEGDRLPRGLAFAAFGKTEEQAEARAQQLISALDGARRL